jgi:hypothetical protein
MIRAASFLIVLLMATASALAIAPDVPTAIDALTQIEAEAGKLRGEKETLQRLWMEELDRTVAERKRADDAETAREADKAAHARAVEELKAAHQRELDDRNSVWLNLIYVGVSGLGAAILVVGVLTMWGWNIGVKGDGMRGIVMGLLLLFLGSMGIFYARTMGLYGFWGALALVTIHVVLDSIGMRKREAGMRDLAHAAAVPLRAGLVEDGETARTLIQNAVEPGLPRAILDEELR